MGLVDQCIHTLGFSVVAVSDNPQHALRESSPDTQSRIAEAVHADMACPSLPAHVHAGDSEAMPLADDSAHEGLATIRA